MEIPEAWRLVPGTAQQYAATPEGDIVRLPRRVEFIRGGQPATREYPMKVLAKSTNEHGHNRVLLTLNEITSNQSVSRLVCFAYHGTPPQIGRDTVLFRDGDPANTRPENLRWGAPGETEFNSNYPVFAEPA